MLLSKFCTSISLLSPYLPRPAATNKTKRALPVPTRFYAAIGIDMMANRVCVHGRGDPIALTYILRNQARRTKTSMFQNNDTSDMSAMDPGRQPLPHTNPTTKPWKKKSLFNHSKKLLFQQGKVDTANNRKVSV